MTKPEDAPSGEPLALRCNDVLAVSKEAKNACTRCGETKPMQEFKKTKQRPSGLSSWCKRCHADAQGMRYAETREAALAKMAARYKSRRGEKLERVAEYRQNHKTEIAARDRKYRETHKEQLAATKATWKRGQIHALTDAYVRDLLIKGSALRRADVPGDLIATKRNQVEFRRLAKLLKDAAHESSKDTD